MPTNTHPTDDQLVQFSSQPTQRSRLPHNSFAELEIISALFRDQSLWDAIAGDLHESDFYDVRHSNIFLSIRELAESGRKFGPSDVGAFLENANKLRSSGGVEYLRELTESDTAALAEDINSSVAEVKAKSLLRQIYAESKKICDSITKQSTRSVNEILEEVESRITNLTRTTNYDITNTHLEKHIDDLSVELQYIKEHGQSRRGIQSGFIGLDSKTNGFLKSALIVIAARPGVGKTALALNIAENLMKAKNGVPVLFFSMEQPGQELLVRLIGSLSDVSQSELTRRRLSSQAQAQIDSTIGILRSNDWNRRLLIDDRSTLTVTEIQKQARAVKRQVGSLGLIIVDYIQLMHPTNRFQDESRTRELAQISGGLKQIARDFDVPVIALSQLNRESDKRTDGRPRLSDLRDSGAIEQDADVVMLLYREDIAKDREEHDGTAELIIAKNRHGETGKIDLIFKESLTRFESYLGKKESRSDDALESNQKQIGESSYEPSSEMPF